MLPIVDYAIHGTPEPVDPALLEAAQAAEATLNIKAPGKPTASPAEITQARTKVGELQAELTEWEKTETVTLTMDSDQFKALLYHVAQNVGNHLAEGYRTRLKSSLTVTLAESKVIRDILGALPVEAGLHMDLPTPSTFYLDLKARLHTTTSALIAMNPPLPVEVPKRVPGVVAQTVQNTPGFNAPGPSAVSLQTKAEV